MGMSHDFEVAIEEGSTCVRVGTAIFGERPALLAKKWTLRRVPHDARQYGERRMRMLFPNAVDEVDPATFAVVRRFRVGAVPQHVVPSYDLETLWVANNAENSTRGLPSWRSSRPRWER